MPQFHYVVGYDSDEDKWFVENDPFAYLPDGNVFYHDRSMAPEWGWNGWHVPDEGSADEELDYELLKTLEYLVDTWPTPKENANG